jgi:hypothetical protein
MSSPYDRLLNREEIENYANLAREVIAARQKERQPEPLADDLVLMLAFATWQLAKHAQAEDADAAH